MRWRGWFFVATAIMLVLAGCSGSEVQPSENQTSPTAAIGPSTNPMSTVGAIDSRTPTPTPSTTPIPTPTFTSTPIPNPWNSKTAVVAVNKSVDPDRNYAGLGQAAITYWEEEGAEYREYDVRFVLKPNASDPDVIIHFVDTLTHCGHQYTLSADFAGCASVLSPESSPDSPEVVTILAGLTREATVLTLKHEFGHLYGIGHGEEPQDIMAEEYGYTFISKPDARNRDYPWEQTVFAVYIEHDSDETDSERQQSKEQIEHTLNYYGSGAEGFMAEDVTFEFTNDRNESDILIEITDKTSEDPSSIGTNWGHDVDTDDELEYYTRTNITVNDIDIDRRGWHVGYWLGFAFGANSIDDLPPPFDEPESDDRENWWR